MRKLKLIALSVLLALTITAVAGATINTAPAQKTNINQPIGKSRIVVGPQLQGGSVFEGYTLQPTIAGSQLQGSSPQLQASNTSTQTLQPAIGEGINGYSLQ